MSKTTYIRQVDWSLIFIYGVLVLFGWLSIYSATYVEGAEFLPTLRNNYGRQLFWIGVCIFVAFIILLIDSKFYTTFSLPIYIFMMLLLAFVLFAGQEVKGAKAWLVIGSIKVQPAEFAKFATNLLLAKFISGRTFKFSSLQDKIVLGIIILIPISFILLQNDTGSMLAYSAFILVLYREGMTPWILILGISSIVLFILALLVPVPIVIGLFLLGLSFFFMNYIHERKDYLSKRFIWIMTIIYVALLFLIIAKVTYGYEPFKTPRLYLYSLSSVIIIIGIAIYINRLKLRYIQQRVLAPLFITIASLIFVASVDFAFNDILQPHQRGRIEVLLGLKEDPSGVGFHGIQSRMTIGSGGFFGKGFLKGTRTHGGFVPEQSTDFVFCTIGEEEGFLGSFVVLGLFIFLLIRIINVAERQRSVFSRVYGYGVASILFIHFVINIGMTIGLVPVIGIPFPFFSYGGSSLLSFTILLFIFIKLDSERFFLLR